MNLLSSISHLGRLTNKIEMSRLQIDLALYGLSPNDWVIKKESKYFYKIEHRNDPHFYFSGLTEKKSGLQKWGRIYLKSI